MNHAACFILISCWAYYSTLATEEVYHSSDKHMDAKRIMWSHIPQDFILIPTLSGASNIEKLSVTLFTSDKMKYMDVYYYLTRIKLDIMFIKAIEKIGAERFCASFSYIYHS
jgi:hypothetical protein